MAVSKSLQTSGEAEEVYIFQISAIAEKLQLLKYFMQSRNPLADHAAHSKLFLKKVRRGQTSQGKKMTGPMKYENLAEFDKEIEKV